MPLVVKLSFKRNKLTNKDTTIESKPSSNSKERVKRYREKLKSDPKLKIKFEKLKLKKKAENESYRQKVKELRKDNAKYDAELKALSRLRQQRHRKKARAALKMKAAETANKSPVKLQRSNSSVKSQTTRKRAERARSTLLDSYAWASTLKHLIKNATPKRKSLMLSNSNGNETDGLSINKIAEVNKVGRPNKTTEHVKRQLAFTGSDGSKLWHKMKQLKQYKTRKSKQASTTKHQKRHRYF